MQTKYFYSVFKNQFSGPWEAKTCEGWDDLPGGNYQTELSACLALNEPHHLHGIRCH